MKPELSFPEFNREWEYNLFSEIVTNKSKRFDPKNEESLKDIELDSIEQNTGRLLNTYMSKDFTSQKNKFDKGSVLYSKLRPYLNKYYYAKIDGVCSSEIWVLNSLYSQKLSNLFLYYFIQTNRFSNVANKSAGSKMPRADWSLVENIRLYKGSIEEQRKIGDFFSKLDQQIELEEKKLELLEQQKRGYMQKLFSQELRFKDGNGNNYSEWIKTNLKFLVSYKNGKGYEKEVVQNGKYNIINLNSISTKGMLKDSGKYTDFEDITLKKNDLIMILSDVAKGNLIGKTAIIDQDDKYLLNQRVASLRIKDESTSNVLFIYYFINYFRQYFINMSTGMSQLNINKSTVEDFLIYLPYIEEQDKIGNFFSNLDKSIIKQLDKIELLKERKKGFLQKMFV